MLFNDAAQRLDYVASVAVVEWYQQGKSRVFGGKKLLSDVCPTLTSHGLAWNWIRPTVI